jgi:hypothetical protein
MSMTQAIDLCQICHPNALRPHFQSGILLGDYPDYLNRSQTHDGVEFVEIDFSCRLPTKFHLCDLVQWTNEGFTPTRPGLLFPKQKGLWDEGLTRLKNDLQDRKSTV